MTWAINLLPWRAQRRRRRWQWSLSALAVSALLGVLGWWRLEVGVSAQIQMQQQHIALLEQQLAEFQTAAEAAEQQHQQRRIQTEALACLRQQRRSVLHLLTVLAETLPDSVVLDGLQQQGRALTVDGRAAAAADIALWLPRLHAKDGRTPTLTVLEADDEQGQRFQVSLQPMGEADVAVTGEALCPLDTVSVSS